MRLIKLSNSTKSIMVDDDFDYKGSIFLHVSGYPCISQKGQCVKLHRHIMQPIPLGKVIDHIDRDKLNAQKTNLRYATHKENRANQKEYSYKNETVGVTFFPRTKRWRAYDWFDGSQIHLGYYKTKLAAIEALERWKAK